MRKALSILYFIGISTYYLYSQTKTITGRVISDDFEILPQVLLFINDTVIAGQTNLNGYFNVEVPISNKTISFLYIGMVKSTIEVLDECDIIEVIMLIDRFKGSFSNRRYEKWLRNGYKKIPEVHKQAFEKGIFEKENPCYLNRQPNVYQ
jgi:hypothetical protein